MSKSQLAAAIYLFSQAEPKGKMFRLNEEELKEKLEAGWVDTPSRLDLPVEMNTGVTVEAAEVAEPQHLIKILESYGFIVLTQEQLKAEANKMASVALDIAQFSNEALIEEAEKRGLKDSEVVETNVEAKDVIAIFLDDPKSLTKEELVAYGNDTFSLGLRINMKEDTLIAKIQEAIDNAE